MKKQFLQKIISLLVVTWCLVATLQAQTRIGAPGAPTSTLDVKGSFAATYNNITATTYTMTTTDYYLAWNGAANGTITLPAATIAAPTQGNIQGRVYQIKNTSTSSNLTVAANGAELLDNQSGAGVASIVLPAGYYAMLISKGTTSGTTWEVALVGVSSTSAVPCIPDYIMSVGGGHVAATANSKVSFSSVATNGITLSSGDYQLKAGNTYRLEASLYESTATTGGGYGALYYSFYNNATNTAITSQNVARNHNAVTAGNTEGPQPLNVSYFTPSSNLTVSLRIHPATFGNPTYVGGLSFISITQINPCGGGGAGTVGADNGLTLGYNSAGNIGLGGTLAKTTDVALAGNNLTFSGTGNVGIGTTALLHKLTVNTTINDELGIGSTINDQRRIFMIPQISSGAYSGLSVLGDAGIFFASSTGNIITSPTTRGLVIAPWRGAPTGLKITEQGNVGIGTNAPLAPLHVIGGPGINASGNITFFNANAAGLTTIGPGANTVGILANGNIWSQGYIVAGGGTITASDERIKNIIGLSNNAQDLRLLRQIEVTDYTMKNIVQFGNKQFKKVIAQQVERVYPQIITTQTDYIPNIYSMATEVSINGNTVTLKTATAHDFKNGDWIRLYNKASVALDVQVSAISGNAFTVNINNPEKQYFIYGKKVEDFRTVDYEALSMLNVSATQELAKQVEVLKAAVSTLETENTALRAQATTGVSRAEYNELKAMVAQLLAQKSAAATTATTDEKK